MLVITCRSKGSLDFISDAFTDGRRFRILTVVDDLTKENVLLAPDRSISGLRVTRELDQAIEERGMPKTIVSPSRDLRRNTLPDYGLRVTDNGTEFTSMAILMGVQDNSIDWHYIQPHSQAYKYALPCKGKNPRKTHLLKASTTGFAPLVHVNMHCWAMDECLNETLFSSLTDAREELEKWRDDYNYHRPHSSIGNLTPSEIVEKIKMDKLAA